MANVKKFVSYIKLKIRIYFKIYIESIFMFFENILLIYYNNDIT